ncbi:hypothetical protein F4777DRAFT_551730 [Nemania sp. FL0916]|nr:hypothetical protein F4777DRAFT_551730 [Nemania sp. FL0916]
MPPHLHPRSRMTSSLFATTVVASFFVVGLPHILPCPAPRVTYADANGASSPDGDGSGSSSSGRRRVVRERSPQQTAQVKDGIVQFQSTGTGGESAASGSESTAPREKRECPVPKPGGVIGELIGLGKKEKEQRPDTIKPAPGNEAEKAKTAANDR